jgi:hypothetical protein
MQDGQTGGPVDRWTEVRMTMRRFFVAAIIASMAPALAVAQSIRGTIVDSVSGKPVASARVAVYNTAFQTVADSLGRFAFSDVPAGDRALTIHTASLDSVAASYTVPVTVLGTTTTIAVRVPSALQIAAMACGDRGYGSGGIVLGKLRIADDSTASLAGTVSAEWPTVGGMAPTWVSGTSDARGRFALCGVPLDTALSMRAVTDGASGQAAGFRVSSAARFGRTELRLRRERTTSATFDGVVTDSTNKPITNAEVMLPDLGKGTGTNEQGAFVLRDIPAGLQHVTVRHVGYGPVETQLTFVGGQTMQRHIMMVRSTTLDSVVVTEKSTDHMLDDFEANRKVGLGHFLTRAELAPQEGRSTAAVLTSVPGAKVYTMGSHGWVGSSRHNATSIHGGGSAHLGLDKSDSLKFAPLWECYALVYLDNNPIWRGQKFTYTVPRVGVVTQWEPLFDINSIPVASIEAIEYYSTAAETPMKYASLNSECGVLVIHSLRFHPKDTTSASPKPPAHDPSP